MPTFGDVGAFQFNEAAEDIPEALQAESKNARAIDALIKVIEAKQARQTQYDDLIYLLDGRTGSGKSTMMITSLFKAFCQPKNTSILCVEPRTALASGNAVDICRYDENLQLGKNVSILTGSEKIHITQPGITYCTSAILNLMLINAAKTGKQMHICRKYQIIVIDEVHTLGEPEIELLLSIRLFLKSIQEDIHIPFMFIFTSATIDFNLLIDYYFGGEFARPRIYKDPFMIGHVKGSVNFPVERRFIEYEDTDLKLYYEKLIKEAWESKSTVKSKGQSIPARDILIFCHTLKTIEKVASIILPVVEAMGKPVFNLTVGKYKDELNAWREANTGKDRVNIITFASGIKSCAPSLLAAPIENNIDVNLYELKIIISTPVIESGKTISTLYACVDNGFHLKPIYKPLTVLNNHVNEKNSPVSNISTLPVDKFMLTQRLGRVGREAPGIFQHCYTEGAYNKLEYPIQDFKNILTVINFIIPTLNQYDIIDPINRNFFVQTFGVDTCMSTNTIAMVNRQVTINGAFVNFSNLNDDFISAIWIQAAQYLYLIHNFSLLDSLMLASVNRKTLSNAYLQPKDILDNVKITLKDIKEAKNVDEMMRISIKDAFDAYKLILKEHNVSHRGLPLRQEFKVLSTAKQDDRDYERKKGKNKQDKQGRRDDRRGNNRRNTSNDRKKHY